MVRRAFPLDDGWATRPTSVLGQETALGPTADDEGVALQWHTREELLTGPLDCFSRDLASGRVEAEIRVAHERCELGVVRAADVDVGEGVGEVEKLVRDAQVRDGFPYKQGFIRVRVYLLAFAEDGINEVDAAFGVAYEVKALGKEQRRGERLFVKAQFRSAVFEGAVQGAVVAVPAARGEPAEIIADEARSLPGLDLGSN